MTMAATANKDPLVKQADRARQLLAASNRKSFDPRTEIDWEAPLVPKAWFLPERFCSLYGTDLWDSLSLEERLLCSREELAASITLGVWTEYVLLQMVARYAYDRDFGSPAVQFALTEVADEVRHMIMFARVVESIGTKTYPIPKMTKMSGRILKSAAPVASLWALILLTEEIFETIQRAMAKDESVQPVVRDMCRIHVFEEARHIGFARTELERFVPKLNVSQRSGLRLLLAMTITTFAREAFNPEMYARAGLDPRCARRAASKNPGNRELFRWAARDIAGYYSSIGLIGGASASLWRRAGFL